MQVPQIRSPADIAHSKYTFTYLLTFRHSTHTATHVLVEALSPTHSLADPADFYLRFNVFHRTFSLLFSTVLLSSVSILCMLLCTAVMRRLLLKLAFTCYSVYRLLIMESLCTATYCSLTRAVVNLVVGGRTALLIEWYYSEWCSSGTAANVNLKLFYIVLSCFYFIVSFVACPVQCCLLQWCTLASKVTLHSVMQCGLNFDIRFFLFK